MSITDQRARVVQAEGEAPQLRRRRWRLAGREAAGTTAGRLAILLAIFLLWQVGSGRWVPEYLVSSPAKIAQRLSELVRDGKIWDDFSATAFEFVLGYGLGVSLGLLAGLVLGALPRVGKLFEPLISALNGIPKIALAPIVVLWLGIGDASKIGIAVMTVFFVMFYNTYIGMRTVPKALVDALRVMGANRLTIVRRVVIPQMSMAILAGLRAGVPFAAIGVIVGEFMASTRGLGYYIRTSTDSYDAAGVFAGIVLLMVLIMAMSVVIALWERRVTRWQR